VDIHIKRAASALLGGGVITCPTEGVYGLSCMPDDPSAVLRLLILKQRDPAKGFILIAADRRQLADWIDPGGAELPEPDPSRPVTWLVPALPDASPLVRGRHRRLAVRLTTHPLARALCLAVDSPLVSTSANVAGGPVARNRYVLRRRFTACVDYILPGDCGPATGPSEIRDLQTDEILRLHRQ
jgi:L-threonylcarbamoyladenylate synthase